VAVLHVTRAARFAARVAAPRLAAADRLAFRAAKAPSASSMPTLTDSRPAAMDSSRTRCAAKRSPITRCRSSNHPNHTGSASGFAGASAIVVRHVGHVVARSIHDVIHAWWNTWPHGVLWDAPSAMTS
jgi:hypothetical protein